MRFHNIFNWMHSHDFSKYEKGYDKERKEGVKKLFSLFY